MDVVADLRERFRFDIARLREAAQRLQHADDRLTSARRRFQSRAGSLSRLATDPGTAELAGSGRVQLLYAQAHAMADLGQKASLRGLLAVPATSLALVGSMAVSRWVWALQALAPVPRGRAAVRSNVEAGRIAYRILGSFRRIKPISGVGQLTSGLVVAECVHKGDLGLAAESIREGFARATKSADPEEVYARVSLALREAAKLLEGVADRAEPAVERLISQGDELEHRVEREFRLIS